MKRFGLVLIFGIAGSAAHAYASFSFQGTFTQDDQLELFQFIAPSTSVTLETLSYAGGTDAASIVIPAGGFDPILSLFDATGGLTATSLLIGQNDDGAGVASDPVTFNAFDSLLTFSAITGHTYVLVLSEADNSANGPAYGNGFLEAGNGDFTPGNFGCSGTAFCDVSGAQRTGNWEVDILGVTNASDITNGGVPEPASMLMMGTGVTGLILLRRKLSGKV